MNVYVIVEGDCEKKVYPAWISYINPSLTYVNIPDEITSNNYIIVKGGGYPYYLSMIKNAIADLNTFRNIDRLVISVDSEEKTLEEKYQEINNYLTQFTIRVDIRIIIQHFCLETWALGNRTIVRRNSNNPTLREYFRIHNVVIKDPELLPPYKFYTRAQFALKYLRTIISDRHTRITYSKGKPWIISTIGYFEQISKRCENTGHISSFHSFIDAFS